MAIAELQQANTIINNATTVLLVVPTRASADAFASMTALAMALRAYKEQHKMAENTVDAVSPTHVPSLLQFLPGSSQTMTTPRKQSDIVVDIAGPTTIDHIRAEPLAGGVRVHMLLPSTATITKEQVETTVRALPYDVAIVIGAADLEELGNVFTANADFFYNTPIINIDHRAENEHFGTVNLVDITAGSCAEVTHELIESRATSISPEIATALYAGIVAGTESFQKPSTTPRSFQIAAQLIEHNANRETVIQHLVKTKPFKLIKLIGRIYARLRHDEHLKLFWSIARNADFQDSGATTTHIPEAVHELVNNIAGFNAAFLLYESRNHTTTNQYHVYLILGKGLKTTRREIQEMLQAKRENGALTFTITAPSLEDAEHNVLERVRNTLPH